MLFEVLLTLGRWRLLAVEIELLGQKTDEIVLELAGAESGKILHFQSPLVCFGTLSPEFQNLACSIHSHLFPVAQCGSARFILRPAPLRRVIQARDSRRLRVPS